MKQPFLNMLRKMVGDPPNPEDVGEYEGYKLNSN
jgi:hypothetical protein